MERFACTLCELCCRETLGRVRGRALDQLNASLEKKREGPMYAFNAPAPGLLIVDAEKDAVEKAVKRNGVSLEPVYGYYDKKSGNVFVVAWKLPWKDTGPCPMFNEANSRCNIFEDRPLVCRMYPLQSADARGMGSLILECPPVDPEKRLAMQQNRAEYIEYFFEELVALNRHTLLWSLPIRLIATLRELGEIEVVEGVPVEQIKKRVSAKDFVSVTAYCRSHKKIAPTLEKFLALAEEKSMREGVEKQLAQARA